MSVSVAVPNIAQMMGVGRRMILWGGRGGPIYHHLLVYFLFRYNNSVVLDICAKNMERVNLNLGTKLFTIQGDKYFRLFLGIK